MTSKVVNFGKNVVQTAHTYSMLQKCNTNKQHTNIPCYKQLDCLAKLCDFYIYGKDLWEEDESDNTNTSEWWPLLSPLTVKTSHSRKTVQEQKQSRVSISNNRKKNEEKLLKTTSEENYKQMD